MQHPFYGPELAEEPVEPIEPMAMEAGEHDNVVPFQPEFVPPHIQKLRQTLITLQRLTALDNCAEVVSDEERSKIGSRVMREFKIDLDSRSDWEERANRAMAMAKQKKEAKSFPWADASNVKYPLLTTAALQFAARAYPAVVDGDKIVKAKVVGPDPNGQLSQAATAIGEHMSTQLLHGLTNWEGDTDTALHQIPIVGCAFRKVYPDKSSQVGFKSELISAFDLIVNQKAKSLEAVPRVSHRFTLYPHEIGERQRSGWFLDIDLKQNENGDDDDEPHTFIEQHRWYDLDGDGTPEPWVITVHHDTEKVVRIKPCFDMDSIEMDQQRGVLVRVKRNEYFVLIPFIPDPEGGFYPVGFGHLLEPISDVIDTSINQMMDSATLQNAGGGFIGAGVDIGKGKAEIKLRPGEYKRVQSPGQDLRQAIVNMDHPGPPQALFELLGMMIDAGKEIASIKDVLVGDSPKNQTATGTMAMIEQGLKVFTAIYKRIYRALTKEFALIAAINRASGNPLYEVSGLAIIPVSDPGMITDMQRMSKAQFVLEEAKAGNPHIDMKKATLRALEAARIENFEELLKDETPPDPLMIAGTVAEVDLKASQAEKTRAETDKVAAEAAAARAAVQIPLGIPIPIPEPQFTPQHLGMPEQQPMPPMGPMGGQGMDGMPPDMMGDQSMMGAQPMMPDQAQNPLMGMVPELMPEEPQPGEGEPF